MTLTDIEERCRAALGRPLPGETAQMRMARRPRGDRHEPIAVEGGVLILLYPRGGEPHVLLTLRTTALSRHRGQVSLPGGVVEPGETPLDAALREAEEEVAVVPSEVRILGALTPLVMPHTGFVLHPFVGIADRRPDLHPAEAEVARILEIPVAELRDASRIKLERRTLDGREYEVPYFDLDGEKVWGATAMVLSELLWMLDGPPVIAMQPTPAQP